MSKQEEAGLILKLYELRREATMRQARDWYFLEFNPQSLADFTNAMFSDHSGHLRMVITYWDMAAGLVNNGAISPELFNDTNGEHIGVFAKLEPLLGENPSRLRTTICRELRKADRRDTRRPQADYRSSRTDQSNPRSAFSKAGRVTKLARQPTGTESS